ncbi:PaaI family thioesterase [Tsukamurella ocularis]|uniref:PaaI family thioesterase n=1 Tax=Tsukamurella ocularis TaxID=1970234 RepID=UPI0021673A6B|nr:PaaI family thioesterase [Tsukamurella ocularis]MCS3780743.1 acyl-coenzyme A thioesterase PaaI-like protein [Tsukamurella ocularis]MCS3786567.1 acyl-coenzyme A thioesterase PaaI-like protein [Tsukamurella ocularis]MCS3850409.1 acyl-coenzyme A thioesterase PaaI-like protein [Tsukamurella ocularis]
MTFEELVSYNASLPFNRWAGIEVLSAGLDEVVLRLERREDLCQDLGGLHAALIAGVLENACGYALAMYPGSVGFVTQLDTHFLRPAQGDAFQAVGRVIKPGRRQSFAEADFFVEVDGARGPRFATARALVVPS